MLIVSENKIVKCGAVVGQDEQNTIIVFHPDLNACERERLARELLSEGEWNEWQVRAS